MQSASLQTFSAALAGLVVGAGLISWFKSESSPVSTSAAPAAADSAHGASAPRRSNAELNAVKLRLQQLERAAAASNQAKSDAGEGAAVDPERAQRIAAQTDPKLATEMELRDRKRADTQFLAEHPDPAWSPEATNAFKKDFQALGETTKFELVDMECRMSLCRAKFRWSSFPEASANWEKLLHAKYEKNCARTVYLPMPDDPEQPYETSAHFDCTEERSK
jgi:hypothetical protein